MDIDVEHEGQRTKVIPPLQNERGEEEMVGGATDGCGANDGGEVKTDCSIREGTQVSSE